MSVGCGVSFCPNIINPLDNLSNEFKEFELWVKFNEYIPLEILRKEYIADYIDVEDMKVSL